MRTNLRPTIGAAVFATAFVLSSVAPGVAAPGNGKGAATAPGQQSAPPGQQATPPGQTQSAGKGANTTGPYDPSGVGLPSGNGKSTDNNGKRPCAGCVGNADTKNPPGQLPGGSDANRGYECDTNQGVGKTNPAHSGCTSTSSPPPGVNPPPRKSTPPPQAPEVTAPVVLGDRAERPSVTSPTEDGSPLGEDVASPPAEVIPSLPFTGGQPLTLALLGTLALLAGAGLGRRLGEPGRGY